jgi:hypothetical protein
MPPTFFRVEIPLPPQPGDTVDRWELGRLRARWYGVPVPVRWACAWQGLPTPGAPPARGPSATVVLVADPLVACGTGEGFKAGVHLGVFGLAVMCLGYNALAFSERRERHLAANVGVYAALAWFELRQIVRHCR